LRFLVPDVHPVIQTVSPSRLDSFRKCPLAFKYRYIDHLPTQPTVAQVNGTATHWALEQLFMLSVGERTLEAAYALLTAAWCDPQIADTVSQLDSDVTVMDAQCRKYIDNYFEMENPDSVHAVGIEVWVSASLRQQVTLRGVMDRLDYGDDGFVIVDYKTGRAPSPKFESDAFAALRFYAWMFKEQFGQLPKALRLLYLASKTTLELQPTESLMRLAVQRGEGVVSAIQRSCDTDLFPAKPGPLCNWCDYRELCPDFKVAKPAKR
jgi:putative RecB family exonuclease